MKDLAFLGVEFNKPDLPLMKSIQANLKVTRISLSLYGSV